MTRFLTILAVAAALGIGLPACGKKDDPRAVRGDDRFPAGYPHGALPGPLVIFRRPGSE